MFKGHITSILISILIHAVLFLLIVHSTKISSPKKITHKRPIQSFIYRNPKIDEINGLKFSDKSENQVPTQLKKLIVEKKSVATNEQEVKPDKPPKNLPPIADSATLSKRRLPEGFKNKKMLTTKGFGQKAMQQLSQLESSINDEIVNTEVLEHFKRRSPSILDGDPISVPHSEQPLSIHEQKEKNTTRYTDKLSIVKGNDGRCTIEEDLSHVGMEGIKAISGFDCGVSSFDASFKSHMKKVIKKLSK